MAFSVIYSTYDVIKKEYMPNIIDSSYIDWYKNHLTKRILLSHSYKSTDDTEHLYFYPDEDGKAGYFAFYANFNYTFYKIYARIMIHLDKKEVYISDIVMDFECISWANAKKYTGKMRAVKRLEDHKRIFKNMMSVFFGEEWRYHLYYKERRANNICKSYIKRLHSISKYMDLPTDLQNLIKEKALPWNQNTTTTLSSEMIEYLTNLHKKNIGGYNTLGTNYAWGSVIGVFNPQ